VTRHESGTALAIPPRIADDLQPSTATPDPVDVALAAISLSIWTRDVVRRLGELLDGAP
jgi:hypothetical protein